LTNIKTVRKQYSEFQESDYQAIMAICHKVFEGPDHAFINEFIRKTPFRDENCAFFAYDNDRLVGFVHLVDTPMDYFGEELRSCELAIVATDPAYQKMGVSSRLTAMFMEEVDKKGYASIFIQGIPYFYRRFGFHYAVPMHSGEFNFEETENSKQNHDNIVEASSEETEFLYDQCLEAREQKPGIYRYRTKSLIRQSLTDYESLDLKKFYYIVMDNREKKGYFCLKNDPDHVNLEEISEMSAHEYEKVYRFLREKASEKGKILLNVPKVSSFVDYLQKLSEKGEGTLKKDLGDYAWQVLVPDYLRFFEAIKPVLENNVAHSEFKDSTIRFDFNTYGELIEFNIKNSKIELKRKPWQLTWDINIPPQALVKMIFDNFSVEELAPVIPDLIIKKKELRQLFKILFPKRPVHFYQGY